MRESTTSLTHPFYDHRNGLELYELEQLTQNIQKGGN